MTDEAAKRPNRPFELPARRQSVTAEWRALLGGAKQTLRFTYGLDAKGMVREVFCGCFKTGENRHAFAQDMCLDISHTLQFGTTIDQLACAYSGADTHSLRGLAREIVVMGVRVQNDFIAAQAEGV